MAKLIVHLGDMKTGSTAIQTALSSKAWHCQTVRLVYPHYGRVSHMALAQSLQEGRGPQRKVRTALIFAEIREEISASECDAVVISAEQFENVEPGELMDALSEYMPEYLDDLRLIAYVRPHAERFPSTYAERVKTGLFLGTLEEMQAQAHQRKTFFYAPRFRKWREVFGDAFTLRPMIRDLLYRKDVVADFLRFVLETEDFTLSETPDANESLSLENLAVVRQLHLKLKEGQRKAENYQSTIGRSLARRMNDSPYRGGTKVRIHRALAETVRDQYAEDAAALDREFFEGSPMLDALNAAPGKAVETAQSVRIEDHFSEREQFLINTFVDQTAVLIKADPDFLSEKLRTEHRSNVIADEGGAEDGGDRPRHAGRGKMRAGAGGKAGGRKGKGKAGGKGKRGKAAARAEAV